LNGGDGPTDVVRLDIGHLDQIAEHIGPFPAGNLAQLAEDLANIGDSLSIAGA